MGRYIGRVLSALKKVTASFKYSYPTYNHTSRVIRYP